MCFVHIGLDPEFRPFNICSRSTPLVWFMLYFVITLLHRMLQELLWRAWVVDLTVCGDVTLTNYSLIDSITATLCSLGATV